MAKINYGSGTLTAAMQQQFEEVQYRRALLAGIVRPYRSFTDADIARITNTQTLRNPAGTLALIKKSIKEIEAEPFDSDARMRISNKINRLEKAGATKQALILETELRTRDCLMRLKEWNYKVLSKADIGKFQKENTVTLTKDGLRLHIDQLDSYIGNTNVGEAKDRLIPDDVLDKLETAKERELFDAFAVLWAEKVKDPLLLGCVDGCKDYFFICEWGEDISFDELVKDNNEPI